jgi:hypothetical protein
MSSPTTVRAFLAKARYTREEVDEWFRGNAFPFAKYDSELGYVHRTRRRAEGIDGSVCIFSYDEYGARRTFAHADRPCRINTYGDSFTNCDQVNDGETWQEALAAHLSEPVRNYGVGGYSVYQAYLRMRREEGRRPAEYVIFNIFEDDHFRSLSCWQALSMGKNWHNLSPTLPHVVPDPEAGTIVEYPNPCPTPESFYNLCDLDWIEERFRDAFVVQMRLAYLDFVEAKRQSPESAGVGMHMAHTSFLDFATENPFYLRAGLVASMRIVEKVEALARSRGKKVLYVLSYSAPAIAKTLRDGARFDQEFVDFLQTKRLPYVDLLELHLADFAQFKVDFDTYQRRYFIGHYSPMGNLLTAFAIKDKLIALLDPKPLTYQAV